MATCLENLRVMVVEDTMTQAMMIQHVLEKEQITAVIARSGEKALKSLSEGNQLPDLILCDVNMPEMNGFELCRRIKADAALRKIPFILLSTLVDSSDLLQVLECGADNFIYKTFEGEYFINRLQSIWATSSASGEIDIALSPTTIMLNGEEHKVSATAQRLANLLVSSFETAVFHNRSTKSTT